MVLEIRLSNFLSIKEEITLDLRAVNIRSQTAQKLNDNLFKYKDTDVLKTVVIYGANASGKSSIINAIRCFVMMILFSHNYNENANLGCPKFKFDNYNKKPSKFFIRFVLEGIEYEYSFSIMQNSIVSESLYFYPNNRISRVFTRNENKGKTKKEKYIFSSHIKRPFDVAENTSNKTLFISRASQMDRDIAKKIFNYFYENFILGYFGYNVPQVELLFSLYKKEILEAMQIADSDIVDIEIRRTKTSIKNYTANIKDLSLSVNSVIEENLKITSYHKVSPNVAFDFLVEESEGTKKLFFMILNIIYIIKNDKILLIDEIEQSLHPSIVEYILNLFRNSNKSQLICSTHNTNLLDFKKLRKDQIYFTNKKDDASTDLYSLCEYKDFRDNMDIEKSYLQGRFDAIPIINDTERNLKSIIDG